MDLEELLRPIIAQILNSMNKKVLLFITGGAVNVKDIFEVLASNRLVKYDIVITEAAKKVISEEYIKSLSGNLIDCKVDMTKAVREADLILVPVMTRNTLAKCAGGVSDNLVTLGISETLMMGKEIIAVRDSFDPSNPVNISLGFTKNPAYNRFLLDFEDKLKSLGMSFVNADNLKMVIGEKFNIGYVKTQNYERLNVMTADTSKTVVEINDKVEVQKTDDKLTGGATKNKKILSGILTVEDIIASVNDAKEVCIRQGALVTPLAKDYIYNNQIKIEYY